MYYHVVVETEDQQYTELDKTDYEEIILNFVVPFLQNNTFQVDEYLINPNVLKRFAIKKSFKETRVLLHEFYNQLGNDVLMVVTRENIIENDDYSLDITKESQNYALENFLQNIEKEKERESLDRSKVIVVHGRDNSSKLNVSRFIEHLGLEAIVIHEQASAGATIIEKIESYSNVGFGIVLYTPCDVGSLASDEEEMKPRARQNVVFEHGFLLGKLGRRNVCALVKEDVQTPSDISGLVYIKMDENNAWKLELAREMINIGYEIDMNNAL